MLAALLLLISSAHAGEVQLGAEAGYQGSVSIEETDLGKSLLYVQPSAKLSFEDRKATQFDINAALRGWVDTQAVRGTSTQSLSINSNTDAWNSEVSIRALSISAARDQWRVVGGFQLVSWGETFGIPILDVVNPRDYRDPLLLDASWVRLPVAALQGQLFLDKLTLQAIITPVGRSTIYPLPGSAFDPTRNTPQVILSDDPRIIPDKGIERAEFGGRASYLFESGLDLGLMAYHHRNRTPVYELVAPTAPATPFTLRPLEDMANTLGASASYTLDSLVLRADAAYHRSPLPADSIGQAELDRPQIQSILGADLTTDDQWTFGAQAQTEYSFLSSHTRKFYWFSAQIRKTLFDGKLEPELFVLRGLNNEDVWYQPKLTWYPGEHWAISGRVDLIGDSPNPGNGLLWAVQDQSRALLWVTLKL